MSNVKRFIERFKTEACGCCDKKGTCGTQCLTLVQHVVEEAIEEDRKWKAISAKKSGYARTADEELKWLKNLRTAAACAGKTRNSLHIFDAQTASEVYADHDEYVTKAVAEIDRLTAEVAESRADAIESSRLYHEQRDRAEALLADFVRTREENAKLREALEAVRFTKALKTLKLTGTEAAVDAALASHTIGEEGGERT